MSRLIDADALENEFGISDADIIAKEAIRSAPTIDAVPVVRCRECRHWHDGTGFCEKNSYFVDGDGVCCSPFESPNWTMFDQDDFCSYGERKEDACGGQNEGT